MAMMVTRGPVVDSRPSLTGWKRGRAGRGRNRQEWSGLHDNLSPLLFFSGSLPLFFLFFLFSAYPQTTNFEAGCYATIGIPFESLWAMPCGFPVGGHIRPSTSGPLPAVLCINLLADIPRPHASKLDSSGNDTYISSTIHSCITGHWRPYH
ncbi:hypothetical protein K402DRAFT_171024 [Aulographum hederae CBS 113979]|uniref:Uncharacterized protein n=1 Tax=Aulographum hederae CBS 113979 TaxID=1176131 RepID=A0A6G1HDJ3_9PEZI|nr:hypothetical protein K402DRAFT_171024 [Aulographum hederae CBS 113979]